MLICVRSRTDNLNKIDRYLFHMMLHHFRDLISLLILPPVETFLLDMNLYSDYLWPEIRIKTIQQRQDTSGDISQISNSN